jgi:hypothetical protein
VSLCCRFLNPVYCPRCVHVHVSGVLFLSLYVQYSLHACSYGCLRHAHVHVYVSQANQAACPSGCPRCMFICMCVHVCPGLICPGCVAVHVLCSPCITRLCMSRLSLVICAQACSACVFGACFICVCVSVCPHVCLCLTLCVRRLRLSSPVLAYRDFHRVFEARNSRGALT